ncbi:hypothetical protein [Arthrobacter sp. NPDC057009]|uniref:hypothetical protein n=1 Tax=Arthrobacter sp. NPDC057009 TaxID=3345996 RepID=UPI00363B2E08
MDKPLHVVIVVGSRSVPEQLFRSALGELSPQAALRRAVGRDVSVSVLSQLPPDEAGDLSAVHVVSPSRRPLADRVLARLPLGGAETVLRKSPLGRLLISLGPTDPSRVFWRAVRADPAALAMLSSADVVLAADLPAVRTAWQVLHTGKVPQAYFGLQAAEKVFTARFRDTQPAV